MTGLDVLFVLTSAATAATSWLAVSRRNPVYAAAWMMAALFGLAVIFLMLHAPFVAVIQVLLYAGAILVLFLFVIMLLNPGPDDPSIEVPAGGMRIGGLAAAAAVFVAIVAGLGSTDFSDPAARFSDAVPANVAPGFGDTLYFGHEVYDRYLLAFEVISLLVMVAIVGAVVLGKRKVDDDEDEGFGTTGPDDLQLPHAHGHAVAHDHTHGNGGHAHDAARPELENAGHHH